MSLCNITCKTARLFLWDRESQPLSCSWTAILSDPRGTLTSRDYRRVSLISKARGWSSLDRWSARLDCHITLDRNFGLCCFVVWKCRNANDEFTLFFLFTCFERPVVIDWFDRRRFWPFDPPLRYGSPFVAFSPLSLSTWLARTRDDAYRRFSIGVCVLNELLRTNDRSLWAGSRFVFLQIHAKSRLIRLSRSFCQISACGFDSCSIPMECVLF